MTIRLLIDGYNLLYATGAPGTVGTRGGPKDLASARNRLLGQLATYLTDGERLTTEIIFDSRRTGESARDAQQSVHLMTVTFSSGFESADDLLELVIRQHPNPKLLTVVSSDQRIQRCAKSRKAIAVDCDRWLMQFVDEPKELRDQCEESSSIQADASDEVNQKRNHIVSADEVQKWLSEFGWDQKKQEDA